jgi:hypothetical protein
MKIMGRRKTQKIIRTGPKNATTGMCPECRTIGKIFILKRINLLNHNFLRQFFNEK